MEAVLDAERLKKRNQDHTLNILLPSYRLAVTQNQTNDYFGRASLIWFLCFPDAGDEVHVHKPFLGDPAYDTHIRDGHVKVSICRELYLHELLTMIF